MYKIYSDTELVYSQEDSEDRSNVVLKPKLTMPLGRAGQLEFTMLSSNAAYKLVQNLSSTISVTYTVGTYAERLIWRGRPLTITRDFYNQKKVLCEGELGYLSDVYTLPYKFDDEGFTAFNFLGVIIDEYNMSCSENKKLNRGGVTHTGTTQPTINVTNTEYSDCFTELNRMQEELSGYIRIQPHAEIFNPNNFVRSTVEFIMFDAANTSKQVIKIGENLLDFVETIDATDFATVVYPLGAMTDIGTRIDIEGHPFPSKLISNDVMAAQYGKIYRVVIWDDEENPGRLTQRGQKWLRDHCKLKPTLRINAFDLSLLTGSYDLRIQVGDRVKIESTPHNINDYFVCSEIVIPLDQPEKAEYQFETIPSS